METSFHILRIMKDNVIRQTDEKLFD